MALSPRFSRFASLFPFAVLVACQPPSSSAKVKISLDAPVVIGATVEDDNLFSLSASVVTPTAPAGEYLLFTAPYAPTSDALLETLDASACGPSCAIDAPGIGTLRARVVLDEAGELRISAGTGDARLFFTLARRSVDGKVIPLGQDPPLALEPIVILEANGGCSNPPAPGLLVSSVPEG